MELLPELLPELLAKERRVLLLSQFTRMLTLIEQELAQRAITWVKLTGQSQKRDQLIGLNSTTRLARTLKDFMQVCRRDTTL